MWPAVPLLVIACMSIALFAYHARLPGPNAVVLGDKLWLPARWGHEKQEWLLSLKERVIKRLGCALYLALAVLGVLTMGWLRGVGLLVVAGFIGLWLGSRSEQPAAPLLAVAVARARQRAAAFRESGYAVSASAAEDLAARIERYLQRAPTVTTAEISRLPRPHHPANVADLLDAWWRGRAEDNFEDDSDMEFAGWLESSEWSPFPDDPHEQRRVALLERVKQEIIAGGRELYADDLRFSQLVEELRAFAES